MPQSPPLSSPAVCNPGYGGKPCAMCEVGTYSPGGNATVGDLKCKACPDGFRTPGNGSTNATACNRELLEGGGVRTHVKSCICMSRGCSLIWTPAAWLELHCIRAQNLPVKGGIIITTTATPQPKNARVDTEGLAANPAPLDNSHPAATTLPLRECASTARQTPPTFSRAGTGQSRATVSCWSLRRLAVAAHKVLRVHNCT